MQTVEISLDTIRVSPHNTRKDLQAGTEDAGLEDLANSIREHGLLNPVIVMSRPGGGYDLIAGQRRYLACRELGKNTISAVVKDDLDPTDATIISLIENVHRADMDPIDKASAYKNLYDRYGTYSRVSKETGMSPTTIRRYMRLLDLAPSLRERMSTAEGPVGIGTMSDLAKHFDADDQEHVLNEIGGFKQGIQRQILKKSGGDLNSIEDLKRQAMEGAFEVQQCSEGLCFDMSDELKQQVRTMLAEPASRNIGSAARQLRVPRRT